jgi:formylmethanofuran dehydrogenase subunit E
MLLEDKINLKDFHGHLGPYAVVGYRMGKIAMSRLDARGKKLSARVMTGTTPPISCIVDGIQFSTSCTLGKGNIEVIDEKLPKAVFSGERSLTITLKGSANQMIMENMADAENLAMRVFGMSDDELFEVVDDAIKPDSDE